MDFRLRDKLELNGFDVEKGLNKFFYSDEAYFSALKNFIKDDLYTSTIRILTLDERLAISNLKRIETLCLNLGLIDFSKKITEIINCLRFKEDYKEILESLNKDYFEIKKLIEGI